MSDKIDFMVLVKGDSSVGDFGYELNVTLQNDGRDDEDFIDHAKEVLVSLYSNDYGCLVYTSEEWQDIIDSEVARMEAEIEGE